MSMLRRWIDENVTNERPGQALVMVGLMLMTLIGFAAIATDTGMVWMNRRSLQNAVDSGALAGVQSLPTDAATAKTVGCDYATNINAVPGMFGEVNTCANVKAEALISTTFYTNDTIKVTARKTIHPIFGWAVGFGDIKIGATATALVGSVGGACAAPLFQTIDLLSTSGVWGGSGITLNKQTIMKTSDSASGNFLGLDFPESHGAKDWRYYLGHPMGCDSPDAVELSGSASTETGNMSGPLNQGMNDRKAAWTAQANCLSNNALDYLRSDGLLWKYPLGTAGNIQLTPTTCYRMIVIPILDAVSTNIQGHKSYPILGFAVFYISDWCNSKTCASPGPGLPTMEKAQLWGYYVKFLAVSDVYTGYNGYGTVTFALID